MQLHINTSKRGLDLCQIHSPMMHIGVKNNDVGIVMNQKFLFGAIIRIGAVTRISAPHVDRRLHNYEGCSIECNTRYV